MKEFIKSAGLLLGCIALARFIDLPANVTPFMAMAVFMPYMTSNRLLQLALPTTLLFATDLIIGLYGPLMLFVYGTMLLTGLLSRLLHKDNIQTLLGTSVLSVVLWHLIVNIPGPFPPLSPEALVFDIRLLASTIAFTSLFYITQKAVQVLTHGKVRIS